MYNISHTKSKSLNPMVLLVEKLGRSLKFPSKAEDRRLKSDALSSSLRNFRSKISEFIAGMLLPGSELVSLRGFKKCFELIHTTNRAFAELAIEIDYPMREWGPNLTDEYLSCTSRLLGLSNAVTSAVSHLTHAKMHLLHALSSSPISADHRFSKIAAAAPPQKLNFERTVGATERQCSGQEHVLLQAHTLCGKIGLLALGLVVSGLCGDAEFYLEVRRNAGGLDDDSLLKKVDSRFYGELMGLRGVMVMLEVREVNMAAERLSAVVGSDNGRSVEELKRRLKVLENSLHEIEKQASDLFSQVLTARNKLLSNIRFPE